MKVLLDTNIIISNEHQVPVVFRAIEGSYKPIRSITIKGIDEGRTAAFKRWLLQNVIKKGSALILN
jgi:hypothetical protein